MATLVSFIHKDRWDAHKDNWSELMLAVYKGNTKKVNELINSGVDLNYVAKKERFEFQLTALEVALRKENEIAVKLLLATNKIAHPKTLIYVACSYNSVSNVEMIIKHGGNPNDTLQKSNYGWSAFIMAINFGSNEVVEYLLKHGANVNQNDGGTPLMYAVSRGYVEKVRLLLAYGADKKIKGYGGKTAIDELDRTYADVSEKSKTEIRKLLSD